MHVDGRVADMRPQITALSKLGTLPPEASASIESVTTLQSLVRSIERPLTNAEAMALVKLFGPEDSCFGLAWALVHLIETAPDWPLEEALPDSNHAWINLLRDRAYSTNAP